MNDNDSHYRIRPGKSQFVTIGRVTMTALVALVLAACQPSGEGSVDDDRLEIVASTTVIGDVVANVVGDDATITVLLPVGADSHLYQLSSEQVAAMERADLVFTNGLGLEEAMTDVLEGLRSDGVRIVELAPLLDPIPFGEDGHEHGDDLSEGTADHGDEDPHVWMDPLRMAEAATFIANELSTISPEVDWEGNARAYAEELDQLDAEIKEILGVVPTGDRVMVTNHDSFAYFAERYEFVIAGTVIPGGSTAADPSSADLAELVSLMREIGTRALFAETSNSSNLADAVAAELGSGVEVVELYTESLGDPGTAAGTYIGMLRENAMRIASALT